MRQNFKGDKRRKEELRKKKQEEKRNKRLNKRAPEPLPLSDAGQAASGVSNAIVTPLSNSDQ